MRTFTYIILLLFGLGFYLLLSISKQKPVKVEIKKPAVVSTQEITSLFLGFIDQCRGEIRTFEKPSCSTLARIQTAAASSQYAQQPSLKPIVLPALNMIREAQTALISVREEYNRTESKPRTLTDTDKSYKQRKTIQLYNIKRSWDAPQKRFLEALSKQETALIAATQPLADTTISSEDPLVIVLESAKREKWIHANSVMLCVEVIRVLDEGVLAEKIERDAAASSNARTGTVGRTTASRERTGQIIFVEGLSGAAETQRMNIVAAMDQTYTYTDIQGERRTVERWIFVRLQ